MFLGGTNKSIKAECEREDDHLAKSDKKVAIRCFSDVQIACCDEIILLKVSMVICDNCGDCDCGDC